MKKNKKNKTIIIILSIFLVILFSSIGYSAFSSTMNITGTAHARVEANVRITDFRLASSNNATSSYEDFGKNYISTNVNLTNQSSTITYYLEITNYGTTDVGIFAITGLPTGVNYSIKDYNLHDKICNDDGKCNSFIKKTYELVITTNSAYSGNVTMNFDFRTYHQVTYTNIYEHNSYPKEVIDGGNLIISFQDNLTRVLFKSNKKELGYYRTVTEGQTITFNNIISNVDISKKPKAAKLVTGTINSLGSEVCIADECFHIISSSSEKITLLANYNLLVGNIYDPNTGTITPIENPTGIQDETARAWIQSYDQPFIGVISYSNDAYWSDNKTFPSYVYNENSNLYSHIENYKKYLIELGADVSNARLISRDEALALGCTTEEYGCTNGPSWLKSGTYWTGTAHSSSKMYIIDQVGRMGANSDNGNIHLGVRPVIELPIDEVYEDGPIKVNGNLNEPGTIVCVDTECFHVVENDGKTIKLLSRYNLYVGDVYDGSNTTPINETPILQNYTALGAIWNSAGKWIWPWIGVVAFNSNKYWDATITTYPHYIYSDSASISTYVNEYKTYIESFGLTINNARLITHEELTKLGCDSSNMTCLAAPKWVYTTTYWTGSLSDNSNIWGVDSCGEFDTQAYNDQYAGGVRPLIEVPLQELDDFTIE